MNHQIIEAGDLRPGDQIFNNQAKHPYNWSTVRSVETRDHEWQCDTGVAKGKAVWVDAGWCTILHPREAVCIQRRQADVD